MFPHWVKLDLTTKGNHTMKTLIIILSLSTLIACNKSGDNSGSQPEVTTTQENNQSETKVKIPTASISFGGGFGINIKQLVLKSVDGEIVAGEIEDSYKAKIPQSITANGEVYDGSQVEIDFRDFQCWYNKSDTQEFEIDHCTGYSEVPSYAPSDLEEVEMHVYGQDDITVTAKLSLVRS